MNKKFLSAILFGALMVSSTGTFVSCKDYDDDIDGLNSRVDGIESQIKDLEAKINAAKWITSVTPAIGGFTVAFSDGSSYTITNGKDGAAGEAGAAGTEWTISEDGFWVCNGEKTTVKAVGQDGAQGEAGKDAQPEVKKENGKWYLWNGTEFEEFAGSAAPATNIPYYYTDPNDANYTILVICDKDGKNEKEIRLPMNEGLAEILILNATRNMTISYYRYNGTAEWNGAKPLPAKGEYLITQPTKSFLIQVTPANYDLAALDLKLVNSKGEEAPVVLGEATPYVGELGVQSRAVSANGIFEVTVSPQDFNTETIKNWEDNFRYKGLSLVANEGVRSTYSSSLYLKKITSVPTIYWDNMGNGYYQDLNEGNEIILNPERVVTNADQSYYVTSADEYIYDAFVTMAAASKADSIKAGVTTDGVKITAKSACNLLVDVNYVNAMGQVKKAQNVTVNFYEGYIAPEIEDFALAAVTHQTVADASKQTQLVDFSTYFAKYANDEASRILWNADASLVKGGQVEIDGTTYSNVQAVWERENEYGDIVTTPVNNLVSAIVLCDKEGKNEGINAKATNLKVKFAANYGNIDFEKGKVTVYATVKMKQADGSIASVQTIAIPVTLKNPAAADIAATYAFNAADFKDNTLTVLDKTTVNVNAKLTKGQLIFDAENMKYDKNSITVGANGDVTLKDAKNMGKSYTIAGVQTMCLGRKYDVSFTVKFVNSKDYELAVPTALSVACAGANEIKVKYGDLVKNDGYTYNYKLTNFAGVLIAANSITDLKFFADKEYATPMTYLDITSDTDKNLTIKSTGDKIANDITVTVYAQFTVNGETIKKSFNVTVTGAL
ncbi:PL29 family lyase N-terminal domain-containing protein [Phocaeicola sartorii]|uniref:PL29 family lyase N-terminal domain-containing protein n=1 Tax=Phocaeicola sartorii TaxID=671267 RepID=UPI001F56C4DA|nr:PL29 family lyase N-terminal domain-containing protein [Phocaeicola sartorii]